MRYPEIAFRALIPALVLSACIAEVERPEHADDEAVLDHVEALGFPRESAELNGDTVLVDGDIVLDRTLLLEGAYEHPVSSSADGLIDKGYRYPALIAPEHQANIKLAFATGRQAPSKAVRDGFIAAAKAWSSIPGSALRISTTNTGPTVTVRMIAAERWKHPATPCPHVDACANISLKGRPGTNLYIRGSSMLGDCTGWSGSNLISITRHELGHTLGFAHPKEHDAKHVKGTKTCPRANELECSEDPMYPTIMGPAFVQRGCVVTPARLTQDDYATAKAVYPEMP